MSTTVPGAATHGVRYGAHAGAAEVVVGLPLENGAEQRRVSLHGVDAQLLAAIRGSDPSDVRVTIVTDEGVEYTLEGCEAVAVSERTSSVELAIGVVRSVRRI